jgi:hypothetical protein
MTTVELEGHIVAYVPTEKWLNLIGLKFRFDGLG